MLERMGLNSDLSLNLHMDYLCMGAVIGLANLHICTCSAEPSLCHTVISTNIKFAGSLYLIFALNQA